MERFDVVVVGLGAMGAATVYQLAKSGVKVLGIDQFDPPHSHGSTHGDTRITRLIYNKGTQVKLVKRSNEIWHDLESATGEHVLTTTGAVFIGDLAAGSNWAEDLSAAARSEGIDHEVLTNAELRSRFPAFAVNGEQTVVYEPGAGVLQVERCVDVQLRMAEQLGATIHRSEKVNAVNVTATGVAVNTDVAQYNADKAVLTAGPWMRSFIPPELAKNLRVQRQVLYWFDIECSYEKLSSPNFPVFVWQAGSDDHEMFYGFPAQDGQHGGLKVATEQYNIDSDPDHIDRVVTQEEVDSIYDRYANRINGLVRKAVRTATCAYTITPDWEYIIDWLPGSARVLFASPCIGRGFKHSAAIGESLAQLAMSGASTIDLSEYKLANRFAQ